MALICECIRIPGTTLGGQFNQMLTEKTIAINKYERAGKHDYGSNELVDLKKIEKIVR